VPTLHLKTQKPKLFVTENRKPPTAPGLLPPPFTAMGRFRRIYVETAARPYPMTRRVLARLRGVPVTEIPHREVLRPRDAPLAARVAEAKTTLLLAVQQAPFLRPCPGTRDYICCGYQVLQIGLNCPFDCTYCILQSYLNLPAVTVFVNVEDLLAEVAVRCGGDAPLLRVGTGEFGDSLALDELTGLHARLIPHFRPPVASVLEIKSKAAAVEHLLPLGPNPQVIFAWSLNPPELVREAERGAAGLESRLKAARKVAAAGFRLAFHFDPLIYFPGWREAYRRTVARLGEAVPPAAVTWISLGGLRFLPPLRRLIWERFPPGALAAQEMVRAPDGKLRYFKNLRVEMYGSLQDLLREALPGVFVYLCMESPRVWQEVFGSAPLGDELAHRLDERARLPQP
jgi:spore photoproduct lyase